MSTINVQRISYKEELIHGKKIEVQTLPEFKDLLQNDSIMNAKPESPFGESVLVNVEDTGVFAWEYPIMSGARRLDTILFKVA